ncbi:MAG TPA: glycosyltransferase family 2 protein [Dehalococcoidia bacterium]|nr:glycosyltransferase family 2 protein [Dehalococcoidia bacterium]
MTEQPGANNQPRTAPVLASVSAFFPCYNDSNTIVGLVRMAETALKRITDDYEIIVIDDASKDNSAAVLDVLTAEMPRLRVVRHEYNRGYGGALISGFQAATKDYVFYTDGDGQYDPSELVNLAAAMLPGVDVVNGYKISRQDPWYRQVIGSLYQHTTRRMFGFPIRDVDCDFRLFRRYVFDCLQLESSDGAICIELVRKLKDSAFRMTEIPVHHYPRAYGTSQFFKPKRIARALKGVAFWYLRLVLLREQKRRARAWRATPSAIEGATQSSS